MYSNYPAVHSNNQRYLQGHLHQLESEHEMHQHEEPADFRVLCPPNIIVNRIGQPLSPDPAPNDLKLD